MGFLNNHYFIVFISAALLLVFSAIGTVRQAGTIDAQSYMSKKQTDWLRGIAIVLIMYAHFYEKTGITYSSGIISQVLSFGFIGVAIFLLLSGYAIMASKITKQHYLKSFIPKRVLKLYVPFLISFIVSILILLCSGNEVSLNDFLGIPIMSLPGTTNWYLKVQLALYIVFYFMALLIKGNKKLILSLFGICFIYMIIGYLCGISNFWYESCYMFPLGMAIALYKKELYNIITKKFVISLCISLVSLALFYGAYFMFGGVGFEILFILGIILLMLCICTKLYGNSRVLLYCGRLSLEIYLAHTVILNFVYAYLPYNNSILGYVLFMLLSLILAIVINKIGKIIIKYCFSVL